MRGSWLAFGLAAGLLAAAPARSQQKPEQPQVPTYSDTTGSEYVLLPVQVFDKKGRFAEGLEKKDFRVRVEGITVDVDTFERDDNAPVSFAFLIDTSGSMRLADKLEHAKSAVRQIVSQRRRGDDFALLTFAEDEVRMVDDFSSDPSRLLRDLDRLEASGGTALFDAVAATPSRMVAGRNGKRAIVLFTDGVDNASQLTSLEMAEILQQVSIPVYAIGMKNVAFDRLTEEERRELALDNLKILASSSGGLMILAGGDEDLRPMAAKINSEVRKQYLLGFAPSGRGSPKYRIIMVSVARPGTWVVRARRGYRGSAPIPLPLSGRLVVPPTAVAASR
jgi:Ca-activated chloride channel family protein